MKNQVKKKKAGRKTKEGCQDQRLWQEKKKKTRRVTGEIER